MTGSADAFGGSMSVHAQEVPEFSGTAVASVEIELDEDYVVTGGTGMTTVNFMFDSSGIVDTNCSFVFDGGPADPFCAVGQTISETVQYGVPFSIDMDMSMLASAGGGGPSDGSWSYHFNEPGMVSFPTPEPSSVYLLIPGIAGTLLAAGWRVKRKSARV